MILQNFLKTFSRFILLEAFRYFLRFGRISKMTAGISEQYSTTVIVTIAPTVLRNLNGIFKNEIKLFELFSLFT